MRTKGAADDLIDRTLAEIADEYGITPMAVSLTITRAVRRLWMATLHPRLRKRPVERKLHRRRAT